MDHEDFDIDSLAAYLHLTPPQVAKMAERDKLPGRKVGGQWRFSPAEIHHWLEERIGASDEGELVDVEGVLDRAAPGDSEHAVSITALLPVEAIEVPLSARTRNSVVNSMVELAARTGLLWDPEKMAEAVRARETLHPTALDNGVALLHPRRPMSTVLAEPIIALGRTHHGIPFGGPRGMLTDIFFLICSIDDRGHLRTLARLSRLVGAPDFLAALREAESPAATHDCLADFESRIPR
ncbi:MAG: PTS sugar transporter subunit IIA [Pirellulaceae bacterium]